MSMENVEVEKAWLNALSYISAGSVEDALKIIEGSRIRPEDFSSAACADVYRSAEAMLRRNEPIDLLSIEASLSYSKAVAGAGGRKFLCSVLMDPSATGVSALEHARIIGDLSLRRRSVDLMRSAATSMMRLDSVPTHILEDFSGAWHQLLNQSPGMTTGEGALHSLMDLLDQAQSGKKDLVIPSGIALLDEHIGGLQPGVLTLVGALPGVGKSALLATIARNVARSRTVGFFSLEDKREWLPKRFLALEADVPLFVLATRPLTAGQMEKVGDKASNVQVTLSKMVIEDGESLTPQDVAGKAKDMIVNFGAKAIIVDHLGELRFERSERYDLDISDSLSILRDVAKRHNVPVVVASHVKRRQGLTVDDEPSLTDFANSSAPERMARVALGLSKGANGTLRVSILKQTNGKSGHSIELGMHEQAGMVVSTEGEMNNGW